MGTGARCHGASSSSRFPKPASFGQPATRPTSTCGPPRKPSWPAIAPLVKDMGGCSSDVETRALDYGIDVLSAEHLAEVRSRTLARVAKVKAAVQDRLTREVTYWDHRASELQLQTDAGKSPRMNPDRAAGRADELQRRKEARLAELDREAQVASAAADRCWRRARRSDRPGAMQPSASHRWRLPSTRSTPPSLSAEPSTRY